MNYCTIGAVVILSVLATFCTAVPLYEDELQPYQEYDFYAPYEQIRERRSPQQNYPPPPPPPPPSHDRGSVAISGGHTNGQGGFIRGDYNHKLWEGRNGARLDANSFYQRNFGSPGPRQDYGGGIRFSAPF